MSSERSEGGTLPIAVDAMGGDHGPQVVVEGVLAAYRELGLSSILVGDESEIRAALRKSGTELPPSITIEHASEVITMDDSPSAAIRGKPNSSIRVAFQLVKEGKASAVVSPGNTGAVMAAGVYVSGTLPGIARPAIASLIPKVGDAKPTVVLDSGANIDCRAEQLTQFALMGSCYAASVLSIEAPRIALLSNGSEPSKGTDVIRSAAAWLQRSPGVRFVGYIEGRDLPRDVADVVVCDGFVGNVLLKSMEGTVELVFDSIRHYVEKSVRGKIGMWLARPIFKSLFRQKLDPSAYGGAPLLGLNHIAIICHGSSNSRAIMNAVRVAKKFVDDQLVNRMGQALAPVAQSAGDYEDGLWNRMGQRFERRKKTTRQKGAAEPSSDEEREEKEK